MAIDAQGVIAADVRFYGDSTQSAFAVSVTSYAIVITNAPWQHPEPVIEPPKRNRVPFYRGLFDQSAPGVARFTSSTATKPKWKPLMGRRKVCRD